MGNNASTLALLLNDWGETNTISISKQSLVRAIANPMATFGKKGVSLLRLYLPPPILVVSLLDALGLSVTFLTC